MGLDLLEVVVHDAPEGMDVRWKAPLLHIVLKTFCTDDEDEVMVVMMALGKLNPPDANLLTCA